MFNLIIKTMKLSILLIVILSFCSFSTLNAKRKCPERVILDTDVGGIGREDVGAIAVLHSLADEGKVKILATVASSKYEGIAAVINTLNTYLGRPDIPIGVPKGPAPNISDTSSTGYVDVILKFPHKIRRNSQVPDSVQVYRQVLAEEEDYSVTIISIGFFSNLARLLKSPADDFSDMNGMELVKIKVKHLVAMAGEYPTGPAEYNIAGDARNAKYALDNWPTSVILAGFEVGTPTVAGEQLISDDFKKRSPIKAAYIKSVTNSVDPAAKVLYTYDLLAVLIAVEGYYPFYDVKSGRIRINANTGVNNWNPNALGMAYVVIRSEALDYTEMELNRLMTR